MLRQENPEEYVKRSRAAIAAHCAAMVGFLDAGAEVFDYGNSLRAEAELGGFERAFAYPGFVPAYIRPLFCDGKGPFRWVALSGDPADIEATDRAVLEEIPDDEPLRRWIELAEEKITYQGLPARICWAGYGERARLGVRFNELVRSGEVSAPIVIGRDHLDSGSVASPYRETESMADGSDPIADWPLLNALVNTASGASWVSIHDGGGVGIGRSLHAGMVCVADGDGSRGGEARAGADQRPRDRRDATRGCRIRAGDRRRRRAGRAVADAGRRVSVREVVEIGDPVLRERARELSPEEIASPAIQKLIDDLIETKRAMHGAGIAANQVGEPVRVAVVEVEEGNPRYPYKPPVPLTVMVNPTIEPLGDETVEINEGCLSVPDLRGSLPRHLAVRVRFLDREGGEHDEVKRGLTAGTFQHEVDHLDGVLFVDRADPRTFATWEQFDRHQRDEFVRRAARFAEEPES